MRTEKGRRYGGYLVVPCIENIRYYQDNIVCFLDNEKEHEASFYAVYQIDGAIKRWIWDFPSHRAAKCYVNYRRGTYDPLRQREIQSTIDRENQEMERMIEEAL